MRRAAGTGGPVNRPSHKTLVRLAGKVTPDMYDLGIHNLLVMPHLFSDQTFLVTAPTRYARIIYSGVDIIIDRIELDPEGAAI
jgi:hypothetical protein